MSKRATIARARRFRQRFACGSVHDLSQCRQIAHMNWSWQVARHGWFAIVALVVLAACGGGSSSDGGGDAPSEQITLSGRITFDRPLFKSAGVGLDLANPVVTPAREVVVEVLDARSNAVIAATTTDENGEYSVNVPANRNVFVRAKAQMRKTGSAPRWHFRVLNNTNGDALYALDGSPFDTGTSDVTRNLHAPTGWGTSSYTGTRAAAPFAILDTVYQAKELILSVDPNATFADLDLFWSPQNRPTVGVFCPDTGDIGTTFYQYEGDRDECPTPAPLPAGIYILGDFQGGAGDTDEFDQHVIAHELGHYFEDHFSRSDSIGGGHDGTERLDFRLAFSEGWGSAFAAMTLEDPLYRDSQGGVSDDFRVDLEADNQTNEGWYSEASIAEILWDLYDDSTTEPHDTIALGFAPIYRTMTGFQRTTDALTSIFSFVQGLRSEATISASALSALLAGENIALADAFGSGERNDGGDATTLPLYIDAIEGAPHLVCVSGRFGARDNNKLGNRKFFRFVNDRARLVTVRADGATNGVGTTAATNPDIFVYRRGAIVAAGLSDDRGSEVLPQIQLDAGLHIVEVYDFDLRNAPSTPRCMTLSIVGN